MRSTPIVCPEAAHDWLHRTVNGSFFVPKGDGLRKGFGDVKRLKRQSFASRFVSHMMEKNGIWYTGLSRFRMRWCFNWCPIHWKFPKPSFFSPNLQINYHPYCDLAKNLVAVDMFCGEKSVYCGFSLALKCFKLLPSVKLGPHQVETNSGQSDAAASAPWDRSAIALGKFDWKLIPHIKLWLRAFYDIALKPVENNICEVSLAASNKVTSMKEWQKVQNLFYYLSTEKSMFRTHCTCFRVWAPS